MTPSSTLTEIMAAVRQLLEGDILSALLLNST